MLFNTPERWTESFEMRTKDEGVLMDEVSIMEENSMWVPNLKSSALEILAIPSLIESADIEARLNLPHELTYENAGEGTKLLLKVGNLYYNVSGAARSTLYETAKLSGSALGRMHQIPLAECLNHGLDVARGNTLMLLRHGKVMALHSDSASGYCIMPISELLDITKSSLQKDFGETEFLEGFHSNTYTQAIWTLPDAQNDIMDAYQNALANAVSSLHPVNFMPAVRFSASDTARSAAMLTPMFRMPNGITFSFCDGVTVKHEKKGKTFGVDKYKEEMGGLFALFKSSMEAIEALSKIEIQNPVNTFVGICNRLNRGGATLPRKYADVAREEIENFAISSPIMSAHDIYLSMAASVSAAKAAGASRYTIFNMEEAIGRTLTFDWKEFDIGGVVAWGDKQTAAA